MTKSALTTQTDTMPPVSRDDVGQKGQESSRSKVRRPITVFMMDLWSIVPYYDAYLCRALKSKRLSVTLGAITYYLDRGCFAARGLRNRPGLLDVVSKQNLPRLLRQLLKLFENVINTLALMFKFLFARPDVIHVQYLPMLQLRLPLEFWFLRYCRSRGSRLVCTVHDILPSDSGDAHKDTFQKLYGMMDALICHSEPIKKELMERFGVAAECIRIIPHGPFFYDFPRLSPASARRQLGLKDDECIVLWQGIIRPYKGISFLLDAWAKVQETGANARLLIAGTGDREMLDAVCNQVRALSLEHSVDLKFEFAEVEKMLLYYQAVDIVVYPYKAVTTSGALMTGVTQGKAIVATSLPPFCDLLQHGRNALLCHYGDTSELASALLLLIDDPAVREKLAGASAALNLGEKMWQQIAEQTAACYESVLT